METQCIETEQDKLVVDESAVELGDMTSNDYHDYLTVFHDSSGRDNFDLLSR